MRTDLFALLLQQYFPLVESPEQLHHVPALVRGSADEFCASRRIDPLMIAAVCRAGYIPMGLEIGGRDVLLIKCHERRCVLDFAELHVSRSTRRKAPGLRLAIDGDFERTLAAAVAYHADRWLTDPLCRALVALERAPLRGVRAHSVEIYDGGELIAGEIGVSCGAVYTSLSGFHHRSGAGAVQLGVLGRLLDECGFAFWDLGMELEYKTRLGAKVLPRETFLSRFAAARERAARLATAERQCADVLASLASR